MKLEIFRNLVLELGFGKKVADAVYIFAPDYSILPVKLATEVKRAELAAQAHQDWNILKFHLKQFALTFLTYPNFLEVPHPTLADATKINLNTGRIVKTDYSSRANPPILHRKEAFIPKNHPKYEEFAKLTKQEESEGLYRDKARIGLRIYWETLIKRKGLTHEGHRLVKSSNKKVNDEISSQHVVERHRTAIRRSGLSKPVKMLMKYKILCDGVSFFDYGCGRGMDIEGLKSLGFSANGWDPAYFPDKKKTEADVVNLGYVLNVIEKASERIEALQKAYILCNRVMIVSVLTCGQETNAHMKRLGDGFLTQHDTFQKFYSPGELEGLIENHLDQDPVTLSLGICLVFKEPVERQAFLSKRSERKIDWTEINHQLRFSKPKFRKEAVVDRYELYRELLDGLWFRMLELGRAPEANEISILEELKANIGGLKKSIDLTVDYHGFELLREARNVREEDVISYLAMKHFDRRFLKKHLPARIKNDIKVFFGDFKTAMKRASEILYAAGDPDELSIAMSDVKMGYYNEQEEHYSFHKSLIDHIPAIFRVFVLCGLRRFGDIEEVDILKIHIRSLKLTLHIYDDFDSKPIPELLRRIKIDLRKDFVTVFDDTEQPDKQLLFFKERFVAKDYLFKKNTKLFASRLNSIGISEELIGHGLKKSEFNEIKERLGLTEALLPKR